MIAIIFEVMPAEGQTNAYLDIATTMRPMVEEVDGVFSDYRLRVAHVLRDYGMFDRDEAPEDSLKAHS